MKLTGVMVLWTAVAMAQVPDGFKVVSATSKQVQLSWNGTQPVTVERKTLTGAYGALTATATSTYTDTTIVGWETYSYRLRSGTATSAEFTVGPPPFGYSTIVPAPAKDFTEVRLGRGTRMIVDGNGDPMVAYVKSDQNNYGDASNGVYFLRWDRLNYKWTAPIQLAAAERTSRNARIGFARDASTGALVVAFDVDPDGTIPLYVSSSNGQSWTRSVLSPPTDGSIREPHLASAGGTGYMVYFEGSHLRLRKGPVTTAISTWAVSTPVPGDPDVAAWFDVEADAAGNVWLAYAAMEAQTNLYAMKLGGTRVLVERNIVSDFIGIALTFTGTNPRLLLNAGFDNQYFYGESNWFYRSNDGGNTWSARTLIRQDGGNEMGWPFAVTTDSKGQGAAVFALTGGNDGDTKCGQPKLARSANLASWTTCAPQGTKVLQQDPDAPDMQLGSGEELLILYDQRQTSGADLAAGLVFWRENIFGTVAAPAISSGGVVNAASFTAAISPGSLVSLFGSNLAGGTGGATSLPLPTSLAGASVLVNGRNAPLVYVSPTQINFQLPFETAAGTASVVVQNAGASSNSALASVGATAPGLLVYGNNRLVVVNQDGSLNGDGNGEAAGRVVVMYGTGQGALDNAIASGAAAGASPLSRPQASVTVTIGGRAAAVGFAGMTPGFVGLLQLNVTVPQMASGNYPVVLNVGGVNSNAPLITVR